MDTCVCMCVVVWLKPHMGIVNGLFYNVTLPSNVAIKLCCCKVKPEGTHVRSCNHYWHQFHEQDMVKLLHYCIVCILAKEKIERGRLMRY